VGISSNGLTHPTMATRYAQFGGGGEGFKLCLVWRVECTMFTLSIQTLSFFFYWSGEGVSKQTVLNIFPKEFSIVLHFIPYALANVVLLSPTTDCSVIHIN